jgi:hypothetical protein
MDFITDLPFYNSYDSILVVVNYLMVHFIMCIKTIINKKMAKLFCCNPNLGLATKARACKVASQEGSLGVTFHAFGNAKECEGMNPHIPK